MEPNPHPNYDPSPTRLVPGALVLNPVRVQLAPRIELAPVEVLLPEAQPPPFRGHLGGRQGLVPIGNAPAPVAIVELGGMLFAVFGFSTDARLLYEHGRHVVDQLELLGRRPHRPGNLETSPLPEAMEPNQ